MARGASDAKRLSAEIATSNHRKKGKMPRQRLGPSSPSWRSIPFGEGLAETGQTRQRLGVSCDLTRNNGATGEMGKALQKKWAQCSPNSSCSSFFNRRSNLLNAIIAHPLAPILEEEAHSFARSALDPENRFATATCGFPIIPVLVESFPHSGRRGRLAPGLSPNALSMPAVR